MQHLIITTANGHEAYFQDDRLIHKSGPDDHHFSARTEGWVAAAEDGETPARIDYTHITGDTIPDWPAIIQRVMKANPNLYPDPSDLMNYHHDDDGQYGM